MKMDWKQTFNFRQPEVLGLDIGSSTVKIIQLCKDSNGYSVTAAGIADIETTAVSAAPGETDTPASSEYIRNEQRLNTVRAIRKCLEPMGVQTKLAVCSVCGPEVAVRDFEFPLLPPNEIEGAVLLEASQVCPFNTQDGTVDYQLIPYNDEKTTGVLVATTNAVIQNKIQLVQESSLECALMDVDGLALLNCFSAYEQPRAGQTVAILNVGSSSTTLAIMGDNEVPFIRDMAYAGNDIIKNIAEETGMSAEKVKKILYGRPESEQTEPSQLHDSLERACNKLIVDVTKTSHYYKAEEKPAVVDKIFVCGGFAMVRGFIELLNTRLPAEAVLWNPFDKIGCKAGLWHQHILEKSGPAMAIAVGLATRST